MAQKNVRSKKETKQKTPKNQPKKTKKHNTKQQQQKIIKTKKDKKRKRERPIDQVNSVDEGKSQLENFKGTLTLTIGIYVLTC